MTTAPQQTSGHPTSLDIAVIGGDGIGPEVVAEGLKVLAAVTGTDGPSVTTTEYDLGARRWHATGETLPDSVLAELRQHDAILLGAIGDPAVPSGVLERGVLLPLRFALEHFVNLRPGKLFPGVRSPLDVATVAPGGIDFVVVREGTEGPYAGKIVESAPVASLFSRPSHPYTLALLACEINPHDAPGERLVTIKGGLPDLVNVPSGCIFADRCPSRFEKCAEEPPPRQVAPGHSAACWLVP